MMEQWFTAESLNLTKQNHTELFLYCKHIMFFCVT